MSNGENAIIAALDIGTNSFHLVIAKVVEGGFEVIETEKETVRIGHGAGDMNELSADAIDRGIACLVRMQKIAASHNAEIRAVATSAVREAKNRFEFIRRAKKEAQIDIEVISGVEEARLIHLGALHGVGEHERPMLLCDIGGGSTEFVLGTETVEAAKSVNIGCVRMSERHFTGDLPDPGQVAAATEDIDEAIAQAAKLVPITTAKTLIAVAGTATTVAAAALDLPEYDRYAIHLSHIPAEKVHLVSQTLIKMTRTQREALGYMHPGRVDVISAGSLVLSRIMRATGATEFVASESDILDGMAWSLV